MGSFIGTSPRERSRASRGTSRGTSGRGWQGWGQQLEPQLWLSFSLALMSSQRGTHSALSQPSQEDTCAEAFSQDSLGVRIKAATALYMVAVVEVATSLSPWMSVKQLVGMTPAPEQTPAHQQ